MAVSTAALVAGAHLFGCARGSGATAHTRSVEPGRSSAGTVATVATVGTGATALPREATFERLSYDGRRARHLDDIQGSSIKLSAAELALLGKNGFVITERRRFPAFAYGYATLYVDDLPVYISADSILDPVHRSYRTMLKNFELSVFVPELVAMFGRMRTALANGAAARFGKEAEADVDLYLAVPFALLTKESASTVRGGDESAAQALVAAVNAAAGLGDGVLFGMRRRMDFSQYTPRGHYEGNPTLERYFRAMMWFGREDARIFTDGLQRRSLRGMLALRTLLDDETMKRWATLDRALDAFVGKRDSMSFSDVDRLVHDVGATSPLEANERSDDMFVRALATGNYGSQRIASSVIFKHPGGPVAPLARSFSPFGQRFVLDSEVFTKLTYDRLPEADRPPRTMPNPLDAAYAVLGNAHAKTLLGPEAKRFPAFGGALEDARTAVDRTSAAEWNDNLYNGWLNSLRTLSPGAPGAEGLPAVAKTEAWARRILNTQLGSWAELRHNTILYAKQSYTVGILCEFPDAYVEPYPEFFGALEAFARRGKEAAALFEKSSGGGYAVSVRDYFTNLQGVAHILGDMAARERRGEPFSDADLAFINQTVKIQRTESGVGCGGPTASSQNLEGWYASLFLDQSDALAFDPTIADVHTGGDPLGDVLHVGTGRPQLMVVTVDTCKGPSTYAGLAYSYYEETTQGFTRLTDSEWRGLVDSKSSPRWLSDITALKEAPKSQR